MLRGMRLFVAAVEEHSFSSAAHREGATQSGVSQHIRNLENRLGAVLFTRTTAAVVPTPAGDAYYRHCIKILSQVDEAEHHISNFSGESVELQIGMPPWLTRRVLAPALIELREQHPNVVVRIVEAHSTALSEQVKDGILDFAIVQAQSSLHEAKCTDFIRSDELLVTRRRTGDEGRRGGRTMEDLRVVLPGKDNQRRKRVEAYCDLNGFELREIMIVDSILCTLDIVASSDWVTFLPSIILATEADHLRFVTTPIDNPSLSFDLIAIESPRRRVDPVARFLLQIFLKEATAMQERFLAAQNAARTSPVAPRRHTGKLRERQPSAFGAIGF